jgi:hypothetical protein
MTGSSPPPPGSQDITLNPTSPGNSLSASIQNQCNQSNGCNDGWEDLGTWQQTCAQGSNYSRRGAICADPHPKNLCPKIGNVYTAYWGTTQGPRLHCVYTSITDPFHPSAAGAFIGSQTNLLGIGGLRDNWCTSQNYSDMINGNCGQFYSTVSNDLPHQKLVRIAKENPNNAWVGNPQLLTEVQTIAEGPSSWAADAVSMIVNYCTVTNPNGWPENTSIPYNY